MTKMMKDFEDLGLSKASDKKSSAEFSGYFDTGSYILNALFSASLYGGMADNKATVFAGESTTGKTFFALGVVKHFQEKNSEGITVYVDTESAVTSEMLEDRGIDPERVLIKEPDTIEEFRTFIVNFVDAYNDRDEADQFPCMIVLDSLGNLSTSKEVEDIASGSEKRDMTRAQLIRGAFRVIRRKIAKANIPLIITNHTYDVVGSYIPTKEMSGGGGAKYTSDTICFLSKKKETDTTTKEVLGNVIKVKLVKSRLSKENKEAEVLLRYDTGLDRYYGLLPLGEKYGIFKKLSRQWEFPDGTKAFEKNIKAEPEKYFTQDILDRLEEAAHKEFSYGTHEDIEEDEDVEDIEDMENDNEYH